MDSSVLKNGGDVVVVDFKYGPNNQRGEQWIEVHVHDNSGKKIPPAAETVRAKLVGLKPGDTLQSGLGKLAEQIRHESKDKNTVDFFMRNTGIETAMWQAADMGMAAP